MSLGLEWELTFFQATSDPHLPWRLLDTHEQVWVSLLWGHCSFFLGPGAHMVLFVPWKSLFPQSCGSSCGSMVGLMVTSSKKAYAIPRYAVPRAPAPAAGHCWPVPPQETPNTVLSQSLWGLWVLVCTRLVWALWASLVGLGFDSKGDFAPLKLLAGASPLPLDIWYLLLATPAPHSHHSSTYHLAWGHTLAYSWNAVEKVD